MITPQAARCTCGHKAYDHLSSVGRCDEGSKRCHCPQYTPLCEVCEGRKFVNAAAVKAGVDWGNASTVSCPNCAQ